jgi:hypothetical protein
MKKNYKIFSDDPQYKSYEELRKEGKSRKEANAIIAGVLIDIKNE